MARATSAREDPAPARHGGQPAEAGRRRRRRCARATSRRSRSPARPGSRTRCGRSSRSGSPTSTGSRTTTPATPPLTLRLIRFQTLPTAFVRAGPAIPRSGNEGNGKVPGRVLRHVRPRLRGHASVIGLLKLRARPRRTSSCDVLTAPFAFGLALLAGLYAFGEISGRALQPGRVAGDVPRPAAVRLRPRRLLDLPDRRCDSGLGVLLATFDTTAVKATATVPGFGKGPAVVFEIAMTAIFVLVILQVTKSGTFGASALIADPADAGRGPLRARSCSAARRSTRRGRSGRRSSATSGPAFWIYFVGPAAGAIIGLARSTRWSSKGDIDFRDNVPQWPARSRARSRAAARP